MPYFQVTRLPAMLKLKICELSCPYETRFPHGPYNLLCIAACRNNKSYRCSEGFDSFFLTASSSEYWAKLTIWTSFEAQKTITNGIIGNSAHPLFPAELCQFYRVTKRLRCEALYPHFRQIFKHQLNYNTWKDVFRPGVDAYVYTYRGYSFCIPD
jgi:hypothetical protein